MTSQQPDHSQTAAITLSQLATIAGRDPSYFSLHKDELPEPVPIHVGTSGRPQLAYSLEQLAELILDRTGHLSDVLCRLRLALSGHRQPVEKDRANMLNLKKLDAYHLCTSPDGTTHVLRNDYADTPPELRALSMADIAAKQADTRARRIARRQLQKDRSHDFS